MQIRMTLHFPFGLVVTIVFVSFTFSGFRIQQPRMLTDSYD